MSSPTLNAVIYQGTASFIGNGLFMVGGTTSNTGYVEFFSSTTFMSQGTQTFTINGNYLTCIGIKTNSRVLCLYKNSSSKEGAVIIQSISPFTYTNINIEPLDCFPVRCICFIFGIAVYFFINALFFIESYISSSLTGDGNYDFFSLLQNEISRLIYSTIVAIVVDMFEKYLSNSKKRLETLIQMKLKKEFKDNAYEILRVMKIRHKIFFIVVLVLMILFCYYTSAFCDVYYNSRINWLEGSIFTFLITNVFIFIYCFLIAVLRYIGLRFSYMILFYKVSQMLI